ncbi:hypothetical protein, partial [Stenotrophomonas maltophilia]|uniref:hypothetical protein n=1 Tax=Stenotrophomonas maltophilia TaxID=40324 RepID=UPI00313BAEBE
MAQDKNQKKTKHKQKNNFKKTFAPPTKKIRFRKQKKKKKPPQPQKQTIKKKPHPPQTTPKKLHQK